MDKIKVKPNGPLLKIGDFAQLCQVTVKTLHHYDELGLLQPFYIESSTNYRYYTVEQLPRIHRIMALKEFGLSLEQIAMMVDEAVSADQIRRMLQVKRAEYHQQMREAQRRIGLIEYRLRMLEAETDFPDLDVVVKQLEPMHVLTYFVPAPPRPSDDGRYMAIMAESLNAAIAGGTIQLIGGTFDIYHGETILPLESPEIQEGQHEIWLEVASTQESVSLPGIGQWTVRNEPAVESAATLLIAADNDSLSGFEKVALLRRWAVDHGYSPAGLMRYLHHRGPLQTLLREEFVIEAQLPLQEIDAG